MQVGVIEDTENRERLAKLLRFYSSKSEDSLTSFEEYKGRMKEGQKAIYYMAADNVQVCMWVVALIAFWALLVCLPAWDGPTTLFTSDYLALTKLLPDLYERWEWPGLRSLSQACAQV